MRTHRFAEQFHATLVWLVAIAALLATPAVWAQVCGTPGKDGVAFSRNTYYPGTGSPAAGATSVTVGTARVDTNASSTPIAVGDLVLIIQMQDSSINNTTATGVYGDGVAGDPGSGSTDLRSSGRYEFKRVNSVAGTTIGLDSGLTYSYTNANANATNGNRRWQVIRVPQFASLTLPGGTLNVTAWNGTTGGVFALDVSGTLGLNGTTIDATGVGFRGGGSQEAAVISGSGVIDYAATQAGGTPPNNLGAAKGEGIAGTPRFVRTTTIVVNGYTGQNLGTSGYPNSRDLARGAPGNAGGGGDQHNAGGGGGGNAGSGGVGGDSFGFFSATNTGGCKFYAPGFWACGGDNSRAVGGFGGLGLTPDPLRLFLGGGGGAGENNNANDNTGTAQGSGGNGGGLIFVRARTITGSGTLNANGQAGQPGGRDGAGGGGGGGTIVVVTESTSIPGLNANAQGGAGGDSGLPLYGNETQGTGGGGGGGAVILPTTLSIGAQSVSGGASGQNEPVAGTLNSLGAAAGAGGVANVDFGSNPFPNPTSCFPQLEVMKTTSTPSRVIPTDTVGQYVIRVANTGLGGAAGVAVVDSLPSPFSVSATTAAAGTASAAGPSAPAISGTSTATIGTAGGTVSNSYLILPGGWVTLTWSVSLDGALPGTYQNPASASYSDPTRSIAGTVISPGDSYTAGGTVPGSNYDSASSTGEDITISGSGATVTSTASLCPSGTREITTTNLVSNADFSDTGASVGNFGGVGLASVNTEPAKDNVAIQVGLASYPTSGGNDRTQLQYPFPGDPARSVSAAANWLFAHGNDFSGAYFGAWSQTVTGLLPGVTYTFLVYVSNPTLPGQTQNDDATLRFGVTQTTVIDAALGTVPDDTAGTGDVWTLMQTTFRATQTTATLSIRNNNTTSSSQDRGRFALAQPTLRPCLPLVDLRVTKSNGVSSINAGSTFSYTLTVANLGPSSAPGTVLVDTDPDGLQCSSVQCLSAGGASCPASPTITALQSTGLQITPSFPANSTVRFVVTCGVEATGW